MNGDKRTEKARLICRNCSTSIPLDAPVWLCPKCEHSLEIQIQSNFPVRKIASRKPDLWRYREALPIRSNKNIISLGEGYTPMLRYAVKKRWIWIKQEHLSPSGSFKDRGAAVLINHLNSIGVKEVVVDSSGNAGAAISAYCAAAGLKCRVFVPAAASSAKLKQIKRYGAVPELINGTRDETTQAALRAARDTYSASHYRNPFFLHGTKTLAFEICEQLGWKCPDTVILPIGNGSLVLGVSLGFRELKSAGIIPHLPRLIGVQAENCAPVYNAFHELLPTKTNKIHATFAEGIAVSHPFRLNDILDSIHLHGGTMISVTETEIESALHQAWGKGFYIEPTASAGLAGTLKYIDSAAGDEIIVTAFTGHGLKYGG